MSGTIVTVRPNSTIGAGNWTANGAASIDAATNDNNDATTARLASGLTSPAYFQVAFAAPGALPALSQIRTITARVRFMGANSTDRIYVSVGTVDAGAGAVQTWTAPSMPAVQTTLTGTSWSYQFGGDDWLTEDLGELFLAVGSVGSTTLGQIDVAELYIDISYNQAPTLAITSTSAFGTPTPTFTVTYTDPENDPQERIRFKVFTAAQVAAGGFDPETTTPYLDFGEIFSATTTATSPTPIADGSYSVYAKAADQGSFGRYGPWTSQAFTVVTTPPATPSVSAAFDSANQRNVVTVQGATNVLTRNQASVETDTTGFVAVSNCAITRSTTFAADGVASLRLASSAAGTMSAGTLSGLNGLIVANGQVWTFQFRIRGAAARTVRIGVQYYDNPSGLALGTPVWGSPVVDTTTGFTIYTLTTTVSAAASSALFYAQLLIEVQGTAGAAEFAYVDMLGAWAGTGTTWSAGTSGTYQYQFLYQLYVVEYSDDSGTTWLQLPRGPTYPTAGPGIFWPLNPALYPTVAASIWENAPLNSATMYYQQIQVYDYEMAPTVARIYRAKAVAQDLATTTWQTSPASAATSPLTYSPAGWNLRDPLNPAHSVFNIWVKLDGEIKQEAQGVFYPLGRLRPIVVSDTLTGWDGKISAVAQTQATTTALEVLWNTQGSLLLQSPRGENRYVRMTSPRERERFVGWARRLSAGFVEVDAP